MRASGEGAVWDDLQTIVDAVLNRRLDRAARAPLLVAFSGGGDSLALLLAAKAWADSAGRTLCAVTVDHRLQPAGATWAAQCAARCETLGVPHAILVWEGEKPETGVSAAARHARHGLISDHARALGAAVVLMGHTADDRLEAAAMRAAGAGVSDPRVWSPSPVWPQGRGVFVLRPLLEVRRAALRAALTACGETGIEDPANVDPARSRARARRQIAASRAEPVVPAVRDAPSSPLLAAVVDGAAGDLAIDRAAIMAAPRDEARRFVAAALLCAAGTAGPPRGERLDGLMARILAGAPFVSTLAGARIAADAATLRFMRDPGEFARRDWRDIALTVDRPVVFDGRFEITARRDGLRVGPALGRAGRLTKTERSRLAAAPPAARAAAPVIVARGGAVRLALAEPEIDLRSLIWPRLAAALSVTNCESMLARVAKTSGTS